MSVDHIVVLSRGHGRFKVSHNLVAVQIKIDPLIAGPAFTATQQLAVKPARRGQVVHRERQMKGWQGSDYLCHKP